MLKPIYLFVSTLFVSFFLTACGGGSAYKGAVNQTSSSVSNLPGSSESSVSLSSFGEVSSSLSLSSYSSARSTSSQSSRVLLNMATLYPVADKPLSTSLLHITPAPSHVQKGESFTVQWVAFSGEGEIKNVNWVQTSGPVVTFTDLHNTLTVTAGDVGDVTLEGRVVDGSGKIASKKLMFNVSEPFSPKAKLLMGNSGGNGIDLVFVGDAFLFEDQEKLESTAQELINYIFEYDDNTLLPYKSLFNIWLIESVSSSRQISYYSPGKNTLFGAYFSCGGIDRLLCVDDQKVMDSVVQHVPQYDQILVLVNSDIYGGAGGAIATASLNPYVKNVVLHELGHSLVNLADEYDYGYEDVFLEYTVEPLEPNVTINKNAPTVKWNHWIGDLNNIVGFHRFDYSNATEVGHFLGGKYLPSGIYRPTFNSIMRSLDEPYGNVNREAWALKIWSYYSEPGNFLPSSNDLPVSENPLVFSVPLTIDPVYTRITWWINDVAIDSPGSTPFLILTSVNESIRSVKVTVEDDTRFIRRDPHGVSKFEHEWSIQ